ncbi:hypothetical protein [Glutamicibacter sp. M10]|uniref:hypothetical protein n=1 Tax=Glutamicibacter sp. M10 TaxID=3023076 RepID=UPI0021CA9049|nr:hypothetical protein [Glutamicibacter sp. M10]UXN30793.1 hypothetical protein N6V40_10085 [Glutamicibacter sp. M10]
MNGFRLRVTGACLVLLTVVGLLSGWSALFSPDALMSTTVQIGSLILGTALVYCGENLAPLGEAS